MSFLESVNYITLIIGFVNKNNCVIMHPMFIYQTKIKLHETDAAGILFFSHQFKIIHDAYEAMLESVAIPFAEIIKQKDFFLPIVHAESDFKIPLFVGDCIEVQVTVENLGKTSFTLTYKLLNAKQDLVGSAQTVHVTVDKKNKKKIPLPAELKEKLQSIK
jgi:1,4-dihydroxy-2-naphthoyl-CoA hydrolase